MLAFLMTTFKRDASWVLEKDIPMGRKGNPSALLVGMQTGEATVENSMEFPQKTKNGTAL